MALGGYFLFTISLEFFSSPIPSMFATVICSLLLGICVYFFLMKFMAGESIFAAVLVTISLGILLQGLICHCAVGDENLAKSDSCWNFWRETVPPG